MSDEKILKANQTKQILDNPIFVEAINEIRSELANEWLNSDQKDSDCRENVYRKRLMLETVMMRLQSVIETGKLATKK